MIWSNHDRSLVHPPAKQSKQPNDEDHRQAMIVILLAQQPAPPPVARARAASGYAMAVQRAGRARSEEEEEKAEAANQQRAKKSSRGGGCAWLLVHSSAHVWCAEEWLLCVEVLYTTTDLVSVFHTIPTATDLFNHYLPSCSIIVYSIIVCHTGPPSLTGRGPRQTRQAIGTACETTGRRNQQTSR